MDFSGGLRANRESSSNVTPGSALEPALPPRISLVRDGAGRELGFHPKGHSLCFARVFPRHWPLILPGSQTHLQVEGGNSRRQRAAWLLGLGAPARPLPHAPAFGARARCAARVARVWLLCAVPSASPPACPGTHTRGAGEALPTQFGIFKPLPSQTRQAPRLYTLCDLFPAKPGCPSCRKTWQPCSPGTEGQPSRLRRESAEDRVPNPDFRASGPPCSARPGCARPGRSLLSSSFPPCL